MIRSCRRLTGDFEEPWKKADNKAKFDELINSRRTESGGKPTDVNTKAVLRWKQDVGKLDRAIPLNHVMQWKTRRRRIQGGHKHEHMIDMQAAIRRGDAEVGDRTKTFFPKMSDNELNSWLSGPEGVQAVIENPDVVSERGRYGRTLRKEVMDLHGR